MVKRKPQPFRRFIPNLVTIMAICAGLTSIRFGIDGRFDHAMYLILLAVIFDAADGRIARILNSASPMGAELDSLADFFNFGIAPGILVYLSIFKSTDGANIGWVAVLLLCVCCALRLARFNVALQAPSTKKTQTFFVGVPAPVLACLVLLPMYLLMIGVELVKDLPFILFIYFLIVGGLAAGTLPTYSLKNLRIKPSLQLPIMLGVVLFIVMFVVYPWHVLIFADLAYLVSIPLAVRAYNRMED
ncbi:MAG: CDP-alcohol phosphatidyltransferase family protein [Alphaproteobacteria bacterium]